MGSSQKAIAKTLIYSDIFNYPLSEEEIWKFLISKKKIDRSEFDREVKKINSIVFREKGFLYIDKNRKNVKRRINKFKHSQEKLDLAIKTIEKLFKIPTVLLIGISGNLSMMNADRNDDIDIFVIARKDTSWITRLLLIAHLKLIRRHRKKDEKDVKNKICLNMIIDEEKLSLREDKRNLYTAHEVVQLKPILQRKNIYEKFLTENSWIKKYMPNSIRKDIKIKKHKDKKNLVTNLIDSILSVRLLENFAKIIQQKKIKRNLTREIIEDKIIALHPKDYKNIILSKYQKRIIKYGL